MILVYRLIIFFIISSIAPLHGYIDPGSGSYLLQLLLAGFFGFLYAIKLQWVAIKNFFSRLFKRTK